ncbi:Hok/Gef family protein [Type-D symbiont of Plautia stali]|uniref:Hok/Gef family protein n=1 Tax=Type-D symbiont of Plautia stali TaxID=1560356 RepID=UPI00073F164F|nr:Hok/Gef family protein [Type-D symbiont of Plautia stali]
MKQREAILIAIFLIAAVLAVILVTRKDLCEVRIRTGHMEVAAFMAYESIK